MSDAQFESFYQQAPAKGSSGNSAGSGGPV